MIDEQPHTLSQMDSATVKTDGDEIVARMLGWLCDMFANPSVRTVVVTALSDLETGFSARETLRTGVLPHACVALQGCLEGRMIRPGMETKASTYLHTHM